MTVLFSSDSSNKGKLEISIDHLHPFMLIMILNDGLFQQDNANSLMYRWHAISAENTVHFHILC